MPTVFKPEVNKPYKIVEGKDKTKTGTCVSKIESDFGRGWADILMPDGKIIRKRYSDLREAKSL